MEQVTLKSTYLTYYTPVVVACVTRESQKARIDSIRRGIGKPSLLSPGRLLCAGSEEPQKEVNTSYKQISNVESQWCLRLSPSNQLAVYTTVNYLEETFHLAF